MYVDILKNNKGGAGTKAILGIFITLALIIVILGGVFGYFWNTTPEKLKIADMEILNGKTLRDLGFADTKFKDIYKQFRELVKADTSNIVVNKPDEQDKTDTESNLDGVSDGTIPTTDGEADYSVIVTTPLVYDARYQQKWNDTSLAYLFDRSVKGSVDKAGNMDTDGVQFLKDIKASVEELTIGRADGASAEMRLVFSIETSSYKGVIKQQLGALGDLIPIPDKLYAVSYFTLTADSENDAKIKAVSVNLKINDTENALSQALFTLLASEAGGQDDMTEEQQKAVINDKIGDVFASIIYNMGDLAVGTVIDNTNQIDPSQPIVNGDAAIKDGYILLITRIE